MQEPEAPQPDEKPVLRINGEDVSLPDVLSLNLDEGIILFDYSGMGVDQVEAMNGLNPHVVKALIHIAIQRKNPDLTFGECREAAGTVTFRQLAAALGTEAEARPPAPDSAAENASGGSGDSSISGPAGEPSSEPQAASDPPPSGTPDSGTATSPSIRSVA